MYLDPRSLTNRRRNAKDVVNSSDGPITA